MNSQLLRFGSVGLLNTAVGLAVIYAALFAGLGDFLSNALGYSVGLLLSFLLHRSWTFAGKGKSLSRDALAFFATWLVAYAVNLGVLSMGRALGWSENPLVHLLAVMAFSATSYLLSDRLVFVSKVSGPRDAKAATDVAFHPFVTVALVVLVALLPLLAVDLPPLIDLLGHVGRYSIQTGLDEHPWLKQYYAFEWRIIGNLGADILIELLDPFTDVETSAWIVVALNQMLAASGVVLLCREIHGRITPFCLFALPLIYCFPFQYGFINFTLSMALALLAFTLWLRLGRTGRIALRAALFVPIAVGIWLCHTFGWAFLGLLCAAESLMRAQENGRAWHLALWDAGWRCLPLAVPLAPMMLWRGQDSTGGLTEGWFLPVEKLVWLWSILRLDNMALDIVSAAILFCLVYAGLRSPRFTRDRTMTAAATLCLLAFLILPVRVFGSFYADMRLAPYMMIVALLAIGDDKLTPRSRKWLMAAGVAFLALRISLTTATYVERERELDAHLEALAAIPEGARVATLVSLPCPVEWDLPWLGHVGSMAIARKSAFANDQWVTGGMNLLSAHYPKAGRFISDPSSIVFPESCGGNGATMHRSVREIPADAFTHVWIVGLPPEEHPARQNFIQIWRGPDSALYRIGGEH